MRRPLMKKNIFIHGFLSIIPGIFFGLLAPLAQAASSPGFQMNPCWAGIACTRPGPLFQQMNNAFFAAAGMIALSIFLVGAFMMVISAGQDTLLQSGKRAMKGSLIGIALVTGSYGIYRTVVYWLYP